MFDATFIMEWTRRDPANDSHRSSDLGSRVGRFGRTYNLGYKVHITVVADSDMLVAVTVL